MLGNFSFSQIKGINNNFDSMKLIFNKFQENLKYKGPEINQSIINSEQEEKTIIANPVLSDVYSIGVILLELYNRRLIEINEISDFQNKLQENHSSNEIILKCLNLSFFNRITMRRLFLLCQKYSNSAAREHYF